MNEENMYLSSISIFSAFTSKRVKTLFICYILFYCMNNKNYEYLDDRIVSISIEKSKSDNNCCRRLMVLK